MKHMLLPQKEPGGKEPGGKKAKCEKKRGKFSFGENE
jgi:hypothetical protein